MGGVIEMKIVEVTWFDAQSSLNSIMIKHLIDEEIIETKSCGYLVHKDKLKVILAFMVFGLNDFEEPMIKHYQIIPMKMVKKIVEVGK